MIRKSSDGRAMREPEVSVVFLCLDEAVVIARWDCRARCLRVPLWGGRDSVAGARL